MYTCRLFQQAYKQNMYGGQYVWFLLGWYQREWWRMGNDTGCTVEQLDQAVEGYFSVDMMDINMSNDKLISEQVRCHSSSLSFVHILIACMGKSMDMIVDIGMGMGMGVDMRIDMGVGMGVGMGVDMGVGMGVDMRVAWMWAWAWACAWTWAWPWAWTSVRAWVWACTCT